MHQYIEKINELKNDTKGINSVREISKLFINFISNPEQTATLLSKREGDLAKIGEELVLGLTSKLSRPIAIEKGKKALLFEINNRISYYVSLYTYINNESRNIEDQIDQTYKLVALTNQQDLFQRMASYNTDQITKDYMTKQLIAVISERFQSNQVDPVEANVFLQKLYTTLTRIGNVSLSEVEQSVIRHTNNFEMITKELETYLGAKTHPQVVLDEITTESTVLLNGEKDCLKYILAQQENGGESLLPILDSIINLLPAAAKKLYQAVTEYKEYADQLSKRFGRCEKKFKEYSEMFKQQVEGFTGPAVTPDEINGVIDAFTVVLKNLVVADSNALGVANKYADIVINHISLYIYIGNLIDLILVSGTIGKGGNNPYAVKQEKKAAIVDKLGELNTVDMLKKEGKPTPPEEPAKSEDGQVENQVAKEDLATEGVWDSIKGFFKAIGRKVFFTKDDNDKYDVHAEIRGINYEAIRDFDLDKSVISTQDTMIVMETSFNSKIAIYKVDDPNYYYFLRNPNDETAVRGLLSDAINNCETAMKLARSKGTASPDKLRDLSKYIKHNGFIWALGRRRLRDAITVKGFPKGHELNKNGTGTIVPEFNLVVMNSNKKADFKLDLSGRELDANSTTFTTMIPADYIKHMEKAEVEFVREAVSFYKNIDFTTLDDSKQSILYGTFCTLNTLMKIYQLDRKYVTLTADAESNAVIMTNGAVADTRWFK